MLSQRLVTQRDPDHVANYYEDGDEPYLGKDAQASEWQGKGAAALGLSGTVDRQRFRELLAGKVTDGKRVRVTKRHDFHDRVALDLTFSAPKSVSLQALVGGDAAVLRAHDLAVERAVAVAEGRAQARKRANGTRFIENTRNLVVAKFRHEMSRAQDPQLHTHALVLNLTQRKDGTWRALGTDEIFKAIRYLGSVYHAELARELQRAGYTLRISREGLFELSHFERAHLTAFSRRTGQMVRRLATAGLTYDAASAGQKLIVALLTRAHKTRVDRHAIHANWRAQASELGIDFGKREALHPRDGQVAPGSVADQIAAYAALEGARRGVRYALAHLTERQAVVEERELFEVALKHAVVEATLSDVERAVERQVASGYLIREAPLYRTADLLPTGRARSRTEWVALLAEHGVTPLAARERVERAISQGRLVAAERRYTTRVAIGREENILKIERKGRGQMEPIARVDDVTAALGQRKLTAGQKEAILLIATTHHRVVGIQGYAGTGKSHMLDVAKTLVEERGHRVVALAPYATQVRALRELGVEARTLASFLVAKDRTLDTRTVLVIDEAGTVATRHMEEALRLAERANARVVLLGDTQQTKAIEAGRPFDQLQEAGMETRVMEEIERQKDPALKEAVALAAKGEASASLRCLKEVFEIREDRARRLAIAADYARMPAEERSRTLVVAGTNEARKEINRAVRVNLGLLGQGQEYRTLTRRDTTEAERGLSRSYEPGDLIQAERNYPDIGLERGGLYEVLENGPRNRLSVRGQKGEVIQFDPGSYRRVSIYEPERAELAPGDRVRITRNNAPLDLANGDRFTVSKVSRTMITLEDGRRRVELPADRPLHLDHAYATTIHSSQGTTADRVLIDAMTRSRTTSKDAYYVAISRARHEARIYTDDASKLPFAIERERPKHAALDLQRG